MKKFAYLIFSVVLMFCGMASAQCSPFQGLGAAQFFDNSGVPLTNGVLYSFQAGTSTQQITFTDSTCTVANVNPITFSTGARVNIWLTTGNFYKFQLCLQNDGSTCAPSDVLFSVDQVPGGASGGGGGGGPPFISGSPNPATAGILRCASGDQCVAFRNAANSANLALTKDANDVLSWAGGSIKFPAVGAPGGLAAGFSWLWNDSTAFRWKVSNNGGTPTQLVVSGVDINTSDQVTQFHFGSTATPLTASIATGNLLQWNGTNIVGAGTTAYSVNAVNLTGQTSNCTTQTFTTPAANGFYRVSFYLVVTTAAGTSSTTPQMNLNWTDADSGVADFAVSTSIVNGAAGGVVLFVNSVFAKSGVAITLTCSGYASNPVNAMTYAIHARAEGPF